MIQISLSICTEIYSNTITARTETSTLSLSSRPWVFLLVIFFSCSSSSIQLYDLGSPAESSNTVPGCSLIDDHCTNMEQLSSCGKRGRCHSEWGSFSCLCEPGFTGPQCDQGKHINVLLIEREVFREQNSEISVELGNFKPYKVYNPNGTCGKFCVPKNVTLLQWEDNLALHKVLLQNSAASLWYLRVFPTWQLN